MKKNNANNIVEPLKNIDISNYCLFLLDKLKVNRVLKENVTSIIEAGENKIAIEILCDCLCEDKAVIKKMLFIELVLLCQYLKVDSIYIDSLSKYVIK